MSVKTLVKYFEANDGKKEDDSFSLLASKHNIPTLTNRPKTEKKIQASKVRHVKKILEDWHNKKEDEKLIQFDFEVDTEEAETTTDTNQYNESVAGVMSAFHPDSNMVMDIDEYCKVYGLPKSNIKSYKLVTHTGVPYYNIAFFEKEEIRESIELIIDRVMLKHRPKKITKFKDNPKGTTIDITSLGDVHIGMSANDNIFKLYWNTDILYTRTDILLNSINLKADKIVLIFGGDTVDGMNEKTTRGLLGHSNHRLPQNLSNEEQIDVATDWLLYILDNVTAKSKSPVEVVYVSNSNHGGVLEFAAGRTVQRLSQTRYKGQVNFILQRGFIGGYKFGNKEFLVTHGYDEAILNRGFGKKLNAVQIDLIEKITEQEEFENPILLRYDQHQYFSDKHNKFIEILHPAFSNPSSWVSMNFAAKYKGGFLKIRLTDNSIGTELIEF